VYRVMIQMWKKNEPIDSVTLQNNIEFRKIGGVQNGQIWDWTTICPTPLSAPFYAQQIHEAYVRRRLSETANRIGQMTKDSDFEILAESARSEIDKALGVTKSPISFVYQEIDKTMESLEEPSRAIPTPWIGLTQAIGGWRQGALYVIGARPGRGKTSIAIQSALEMAKYGAVAFSSLEMRREEIHKRIISMTASIPMDSLMNNKLNDREWEKWAILRPQVQPEIAIDDRAEVTIQDIKTHARSVNRVKPLSAIIVDYLQLMTSRDNRPRHEIVSDFSRQLKIMARDLNVPVIALSQLNRSSEGRIDKKPSLGDLRESGAIEQDADVVILLHLDDEGDMILDVAKNRHGAQAIVKLYWEGQYARAI
jgi:replicative DNA helicase